MADPSKTESATPRRREEARKRGQVARSMELTSALTLLGMLVVLNLAGGYMLDEIAKVARYAWGGLGTFSFSETEIRRQTLTFFLELGLVTAPMLLGAVVIGILANVLQFGFIFAPEALRLRFENLSPAHGLERMFSRRSAVELAKSLIKIAVIGVTAWLTVAGRVPTLMSLMDSDLTLFFGAVGSAATAVMLRVGLVMLGMSLLDFFYQRWEFEESLKMSKQEIKDEYRQMEGDPLIKSRIRKMQAEAARRRMFAELPKADVVITNPLGGGAQVRRQFHGRPGGAGQGRPADGGPHQGHRQGKRDSGDGKQTPGAGALSLGAGGGAGPRSLFFGDRRNFGLRLPGQGHAGIEGPSEPGTHRPQGLGSRLGRGARPRGMRKSDGLRGVHG
jgi:flagellar biosynthetic protein FlhB